MATVTLISARAMSKLVAELPEVKAEIVAKANEVGAEASARLRAHADTGAASIEVVDGDIDAYVVLDDKAAMSIEFDHKHNFSGREVKGLYILHGAAGLL